MGRSGHAAVTTVRRAVVATVLVTGGIAASESGEAQAATSIVAAYEMNEGSGASVMIDSGPYGLHGTIGDDVDTNYNVAGATGYRWRFTPPARPPAMPERIVNVDSDDELNPEGEHFAVEFRYRTTQNFGNVVQKGQNGSLGGYFKFEQPNGRMTCLFKGGNGQQRAVGSPIATNDGEWHVIRCERSDWGIRLFVDGVQVRQLRGPTGNIANNKPLSIGGKTVCDQIRISCDYFTGQIDYVRIEKAGTGNPPPPPPPDNENPEAVFTSQCSGLQCSFSSAGSNDPDGDIVDRSWNLGDGQSGAGWTSDHTYDAPGTYQVTLTVTDDDGATDSTQQNVTVGSAASDVEYVASSTRSGWSRQPTLELPTMQDGDTVLLFASVTTGASIFNPSGGGWDPVETASGAKGTTQVWQKTAGPSDSGDDVSIGLSQGSKYNLSAVVYRGTSGVTASDDHVDLSYTDERVTPTVGVTDNGSLGVSFWLHRDSSSSSLAAPPGVVTRVAMSQSGGGRATVLIADSGGPVGGSYGGLTAEAPRASTYGLTMTLILGPG